MPTTDQAPRPSSDPTQPRFDDIVALFVNCTLKRSPETSNTLGLIDLSRSIMERNGVAVEVIRAVDHDIATGVWPDMTEHGWPRDAWPDLYAKVMAADILVIAGPIWLGDNSSVTKQVIERLYACSSILHSAGQYAYYGRVGGWLITGKRGRRQALRHERPLQPAAPRLLHPSAGRLRLDRRGRPRAVRSGSWLRRARQRLHEPQHHVHDMESHAPGEDAQGRRRIPGARLPCG